MRAQTNSRFMDAQMLVEYLQKLRLSSLTTRWQQGLELPNMPFRSLPRTNVNQFLFPLSGFFCGCVQQNLQYPKP